MIDVIFNSVLYISAIFIYWNKYHKINCGFILLSLYSFVSIMCVINYISDPLFYPHITLLPFIYLFITVLFFARPFLYDSDIIASKLKIKNYKFINYFILIYIVCAFLEIFYNYRIVYNNIMDNDWNTIRNSVYNNDIELYHSQIERFIKIFVSYTTSFAILCLFYILSTMKDGVKKYTKIFILFCAITLPTLTSSIIVASRGMIITFFFSLLIGYNLFKNRISKKNKIIIFFSFVILSFIFIIYSLSVTNSRFGGSNNDASNSLIYYFGHSMLTFNDGIMDSIKRYMLGGFLFNNSHSIYMGGIDNYLGTHIGSSFFTFIGALYIDFGPITTLLLSIILPQILYKRILRGSIGIEDLYFYHFSLYFLLNGVFVIGAGYYIGWVMFIAIYFSIKISNKWIK